MSTFSSVRLKTCISSYSSILVTEGYYSSRTHARSYPRQDVPGFFYFQVVPCFYRGLPSRTRRSPTRALFLLSNNIIIE